jgi:hypothetical protein
LAPQLVSDEPVQSRPQYLAVPPPPSCRQWEPAAQSDVAAHAWHEPPVEPVEPVEPVVPVMEPGQAPVSG